MPTYSGGLGVLAGDTLRAAADLGLPMVGVTLLHRKGYFRQQLDERGDQCEDPVEWSPDQFLEPMEPRIQVRLEDRQVEVRAWRYIIQGLSGDPVEVLFLDTDLSTNDSWHRTLTDHLYGGDDRYRLSQEVLLGIGGVKMLEALGYGKIDAYHLNEGHAALLTVALLDRRLRDNGYRSPTQVDIESVRRNCVFTTHTPVPAGHDQFPAELARRVLGDERISLLEHSGAIRGGVLNLTYVGLTLSRFVNGVATRHSEVARGMFPGYPVNSITNGVHAMTWTSEPFRRLFDQYIPEWQRDNRYLRYAVSLPIDALANAHAGTKDSLIEAIQRRTGTALDPSVFTIGFARRATAYKRGDLLFTDPERLRQIASDVGRIQLVFSGKAHPRDGGGKELIRRVHQAASSLRGDLEIVYLEDYDMTLGHLICSGVDLWLNTTQKPLEASGTSGMKAALNGVPSLSVLDGWWIEGHIEGVTGWSIGDASAESDTMLEVESLYTKLERTIIPLYYERPVSYAEIGRWAIALNGSFFNAQRMVSQYEFNAYGEAGKTPLG